MAEAYKSALDGAILDAVIRSSLECIIVVDEESCVMEFNPAAERTFGRDRASALGKPIGDLIIPEHLRAAHTNGFKRYLAEGDPHVLGRRVEIEGARADGTIFPVELTITEVLVGNRRLFTASLRDLSERRAVEAALRTSEARMAAFMANAPLGMYLKDEDGTIIVANDEMRRAFPDRNETPLSDRIGRSASDFLDEETAQLIAAQDARALSTNSTQTDEWHRPHLARYAWAATIRFPVHIEGSPKQVGGFVIDLTARKNAELALAKSREALHQSEKLNALGSLLAGVSHELNNPLSAVIGQTMMLEEDAVGTTFAARAERIRVAAERCARIVEIFLAMARQKPPRRTAVQVNDVVASALELLTYGLRASDVTIQSELASDMPHIHADADQLHQVLVNLIVNAQQALESCPVPRILTLATRLANDGATVELEVGDNGPGIPEAAARRIFEPFYTTKPAGSGTGIGLSFSLGVIEAHGGKLRLLEGGGGAKFVIALPVEPFEPMAIEERTSVRATMGRGTALIIDDDAGVSEALGELVEREGYAIERVDSGASALARLQLQDYDLILTDLRMPEMDGPALFAWIERERPHLTARVGFLTGDVLSGSAAIFLEQAKRPYAEKPFTPATVRALIAEVLATR